MAVFDFALGAGSLEAVSASPFSARTPSTARQGNRKNNNNNAQQRQQAQKKGGAAAANLQKAQQNFSAAAAVAGVAQSKLQMANGKVESAKGTLDTSKDAGESASDELHQLEAQIEEAQGADSPVAKARLASAEASLALKKLHDQIESGVEYRQAKADALASADKTGKLADLQQRFFTSNPNYLQAKAAAELMGARLSEIRKALFTEDSRWQETVQSSRSARGQASEANRQLHGSLLHKAQAADDFREAAAVANAAQANLQQAQARAKAAGAGQGKKKSKPTANSKK